MLVQKCTHSIEYKLEMSKWFQSLPRLEIGNMGLDMLKIKTCGILEDVNILT